MASRRQRRERAAQRQRDGQGDAPAPHEPARAGAVGVVQRHGAPVEKNSRQRDRLETQDALPGEKRPLAPPVDLDELLKLSEENSVHSAAIDAKVADTVGRGWLLEIEDDSEPGDGSDQEQAERLLREWLRQVCPQETWSELTDQIMREQDALGWGCWEITREGADPASPITGVYALPGQTLRATKQPDVYVQLQGPERTFFKRFGVKLHVNARTGDVADDVPEDERATEVLIFKLYTPRSRRYGLPRWIAATPDLAELAAIRSYNIAWFGGGGKVDRFVHVEAGQDGSSDDAKAIADDVVEQVEEAKGADHVTVVSYGPHGSKVHVHFLAPNIGQRDGQFRNERQDLVKQVLIAHQVPPYRVGWAELGSLGGSAAKEMLDAYRYGTIEPPQEKLEELLARTLFNPEVGGYNLGQWTFRFNDVDWDQMAQDMETAARAVEYGIASPDEGREMVGKEPTGRPEMTRHYFKGQPLEEGDPEAVEEALDVVKHVRAALEAVVKDEAVAAPTRKRRGWRKTTEVAR